MPEFLDKLHTAALRAKNLEVGIQDYTSVIKSSDTNRPSSQERLTGENAHTGGSGQIYAWDGDFIESRGFLGVFSLSLKSGTITLQPQT